MNESDKKHWWLSNVFQTFEGPKHECNHADLEVVWIMGYTYVRYAENLLYIVISKLYAWGSAKVKVVASVAAQSTTWVSKSEDRVPKTYHGSSHVFPP